MHEPSPQAKALSRRLLIGVAVTSAGALAVGGSTAAATPRTLPRTMPLECLADLRWTR